jgi:hypothetical protein
MKYFILVLGLTLGLAMPAAAHHNWAALYDVKGDVEIEGVVSKVIWRNPHVVIYFTVDGGTPNEKVYTTASNSVAALARMNVTKDLVAVGTKVKAAGYPSRTVEGDFFMNHLLLEDEHREIVFLRTAEARWPKEAERVGDANYAHGLNAQEDISERPTSVFAVWSTIFGAEGSHRALKGPGPDFRIDYVEPRGVADCSSKDLWSEMGAPYPMQIVDNKDGTITIHEEQNDTIRPVFMNIEHKDPGTVKNNLGYSTGRFVGGTLMVTTTFEGSNSPIQMHETFTLSGDRNHLNYTQTLINPESNELPTVGAKWWEFQPNSYVQPYDCVSTEEAEKYSK